MLSDYALEHSDECCLIFTLKSTNDLVQAIYYSLQANEHYNWLIVEGVSEKIYFEYYAGETGYLFFGDDRHITHSFGSYPYAMLYAPGKVWVLIDLDQKKAPLKWSFFI